MKDYKEQMDGLHFTQEQKAQMVERLMAAQAKTAKHRRMPRMAAAGVAAALVLTVGAAGASGVLKTAGEAFSGVFGGSAAETEIIDKIGRPIGASDTSNGVTITADAIVGDKYHYAITYSVSKDDGTAFDIDLSDVVGEKYLPLLFEQADTNIGRLGGEHGSSYFYDADPDDNAIQYVEMREADGEIPHGTARASFENLCLNDGEQTRTLAEGKWNLKFQMDFEDTSVSLPAGQTFALNGMHAVIDKITLSPIAMRVDYTVDREIQWGDSESGRQSEHDRKQSQDYFGSVKILVNKKDGTSVDLSMAGGSIQPEDGKTVCQKGNVFDEIIPLEEIVSVTVQGIEVPVHV